MATSSRLFSSRGATAPVVYTDESARRRHFAAGGQLSWLHVRLTITKRPYTASPMMGGDTPLARFEAAPDYSARHANRSRRAATGATARRVASFDSEAHVTPPGSLLAMLAHHGISTFTSFSKCAEAGRLSRIRYASYWRIIEDV